MGLNHHVGKCPATMSPSDVQALLDDAIPYVPPRWSRSYPPRLYAVTLDAVADERARTAVGAWRTRNDHDRMKVIEAATGYLPELVAEIESGTVKATKSR